MWQREEGSHDPDDSNIYDTLGDGDPRLQWMHDDQSEGRVEQCDHDVRHCQVDNEEAGGRVHALVLEDDMTDQDITEEREDDGE